VEQLLPRYAAYFHADANKGRGATFVYKDGCPPIPDVDRTIPGQDCPAFWNMATAFIQDNPFKRLVVVSAWTYFHDDDGRVSANKICFIDPGRACRRAPETKEFSDLTWAAFARLSLYWRTIERSGKEVVVVALNAMPDRETAASLYRKTYFAEHPVGAPAIEPDQIAAQYSFVRGPLLTAIKAANAELVDPLDHCPSGRCSFYDQGHFLFKDGSHVRASLIGRARFSYLDPLMRYESAPTIGE
jgi:hypothetical protein